MTSGKTHQLSLTLSTTIGAQTQTHTHKRVKVSERNTIEIDTCLQQEIKKEREINHCCCCCGFVALQEARFVCMFVCVQLGSIFSLSLAALWLWLWFYSLFSVVVAQNKANLFVAFSVFCFLHYVWMCYLCAVCVWHTKESRLLHSWWLVVLLLRFVLLASNEQELMCLSQSAV